ncbi:MAG: ABC transporter ATP-binding protein [SAR324 cluster bacterium]|uniref:ABC transporter ATP-binding protein n=1 Tax=SAR324 cluster bacterium TaxID=2024889 RepID=A0A2A4T131_9DELT|nr:MAG: ABC transporter ATP-binding protein [SAR324 cluster bacterium]
METMISAVPRSSFPAPEGLILEVSNLAIQFGGNSVLRDCNLQVKQGDFLSIIGPNGAGKSTLFNLISGFYRPNSGSIYWQDREITRFSVAKRARLGIGRSFQTAEDYSEMTLLKNLSIPIRQKLGLSWHCWRSAHKFGEVRDKAEFFLEKVNLSHKKNHLPSTLTYGEQKKLDIAMVLAQEPVIMLLDEPSAGIALEEESMMLELLQQLKAEGKYTILLVEHKLNLVFELSDTVAVLDKGKVIAQGKPNSIRNNPAVQAAYLGKRFQTH